MILKKTFLIPLVLFLAISYSFAGTAPADKEAKAKQRRLQAMEKEIAKVMAQRNKIIEETLFSLAKEKQKQPFFFIRRLELAQNPLKQKEMLLV